MADYSNLLHLDKVWPHTVVSYAANRNRPTDEMYLEAFGRIDPPLLLENEARVVRSALNPQRGRPQKGAPRMEQVANRIALSERSDIPKELLALLGDRLRNGERYTEADFGTALWRCREKQERKSFVWFIYDEIYARLDGGEFVDHPVLGRLNVPRNQETRSARAVEMTHFVLNRMMRRNPPSERTLLNIITERNRRRFRESPPA